jgi:glutathione S-transferase
VLTVYGASYSVYSRILRLALVEKGVAHDWVETDVFGADRMMQTARHPFGKIPSLDDDGFALYETGACIRYLEQPCFGATRLMPEDPRLRARADQITGIIDAYGYRAMVWDCFVELIRKPANGEATDGETVARGLATSQTVLDAISGLASDEAPGALAGSRIAIADLFLAPVLAYFLCTAPGCEMVAAHPRIARWWDHWRARPSMTATRSPLETEPR